MGRSQRSGTRSTQQPDLVKMLCFCAMTHDNGPTQRFKAVCKTGQGLPALMQKLSVRPTASHLGNRGLDP